ncbi:hypothetical protein MMO06_24165, partial [Escherichia coli]|nr:hypothetical protein [Escherichia coli]
EGWAILLRQKQKKLIMLPSETMIWQPEFTDKTLSRKPGAVQNVFFTATYVFLSSGTVIQILHTGLTAGSCKWHIFSKIAKVTFVTG